MLGLLASLLVCGIPYEPFPVDYVDAVEVNTVVNSDGTRRFTQVLWLDIGGPNEIRGWSFLAEDMLPQYGLCLFVEKGILRAIHVVHKDVIYSKTSYDPEVERRKCQPIHFRRGLKDATP